MKNDLLRYISKFMVVCLFMAMAPQVPAYASSGSGATQVVKAPIDGTLTNCLGNPVDVNGIATLVLHATETGNTVTFVENISVALSGSDSSGNTYRGSVNESIVETLAPGSEVTESVSIRLVGGPKGTSVLVHLVVHETLDAAGNISVNFENVSGNGCSSTL